MRRRVRRAGADLVYAEVPPNSLSREAARYKRKHPETKLILDIFDMWPEGFPDNRAKKLLALPFRVWAWFRNRGLSKADLVITECDLFRNRLQKHLKNTPNHTLHLCRPGATASQVRPVAETGALHLCYLGSINNIIDIPAIAGLIEQVQKLRPAVLHIIGDGETRDLFIDRVKATGAEVIFHGKIYDSAQKQAIFDQCHYGLNIMKESVFIGLTMKSLDYFAGGLPIVNTIAGDTAQLVQTLGVGVNLDRDCPERTAATLANITPEENLAMRRATLDMFHRLFTTNVIQQKLHQLL